MPKSNTIKRSFPQHGPHDTKTTDKRLLGLKSSIKSLKDQVSASIVPQQLEKTKDLLLTIVLNLIPDQKDVFLFVDRVVELSMKVFILLEATEGVPHATLENFFKTLEDVKTFVMSVKGWNVAYPRSAEPLEKLLSIKRPVVEKRFEAIIEGLEALFSDAQIKPTPTDGSSNLPNNAYSNMFSNARNFTMNNPQFYSVPGGTVHLITHQVERHPEILGPPPFDNLELEMELYQGSKYRIHRGRAYGRAVVVKVFQGPHAEQLSLKTAKFYHGLMHPNVLRMIRGPDHNLGSSFIVFDGDYQGTAESYLAVALKEGIKEGSVVGAKTVIACSLGLDYLQELGLPFPIMGPEHFVLLVSTQGRISLSFDAEKTWHAAYNNDVHYDQVAKICHELIQKTFFSSCKEHYQDRRLYSDEDEAHQTLLEDTDAFDDAENALHLGAPSRGSKNRKILQKDKGNRRELVWKPHLATSDSLKDVGRHYQASLARFVSDDVLLARRLGHSLTHSAHRCPGYKRIEIILTPDIEQSSVVSYTFPVPNEICSVCGEKVGTRYMNITTNTQPKIDSPASPSSASSGVQNSQSARPNLPGQNRDRYKDHPGPSSERPFTVKDKLFANPRDYDIESVEWGHDGDIEFLQQEEGYNAVKSGYDDTVMEPGPVELGDRSFAALKLSNLDDTEYLTKTSKAASSSYLDQLERQRVENLNRRLWHLQNLIVDPDNARPQSEFKRLSKSMGDRLDKEKDRSVEELEAPDFKRNHFTYMIRQRAAEKERRREASHWNAPPGTSTAPVKKPYTKPPKFSKRVKAARAQQEDDVMSDSETTHNPTIVATDNSTLPPAPLQTLHFPSLFSNDFGPYVLLYAAPSVINRDTSYGEGFNLSVNNEQYSVSRPTIELALDDLLLNEE